MSGWVHFVQFGLKEKRPSPPIPDHIRRAIETPVALEPPARLMQRTTATEDIKRFSLTGKLIAFDVAAAFEICGPLPKSPKILDFGCGCGRVLPWLQMIYPSAKAYGCDIESDLAGWLRDNLRDAEISVTDHQPPLPFPNNFFDAVYSISVFTHLPEDMQFAWLRELGRVTKPGGRLAFTTHGPSVQPALKNRDFVYSEGISSKDFPSFYQNTFHSHEYIKREWSRYMTLDGIFPKGCAGHQDMVAGRAG